MTVIVVDDERIILTVETEQVRKALPRAEVVPFQFGEDALEYAENNVVDIAFLDISLEDAQGISLAKSLQKTNPRINIIFCTGYSEYALDALDVYCSAYLLKPMTEEKLNKALSQLRYPVKNRKLKIRCFGNFEVYFNDEPLKFRYSKTKEMLAFLIDRKGALVSTKEIMTALFETDDKSSYVRNIKVDLIDTLTSFGIEDVVYQEWGKIGIDTKKVECDYYDYLDGAKFLFAGEYMSQYSFSNNTQKMLLNKKFNQ